MDDEHALVAGGVDGAVHSGEHDLEAFDGAAGVVIVPDVAEDQGRGGGIHGFAVGEDFPGVVGAGVEDEALGAEVQG